MSNDPQETPSSEESSEQSTSEQQTASVNQEAAPPADVQPQDLPQRAVPEAQAVPETATNVEPSPSTTTGPPPSPAAVPEPPADQQVAPPAADVGGAAQSSTAQPSLDAEPPAAAVPPAATAPPAIETSPASNESSAASTEVSPPATQHPEAADQQPSAKQRVREKMTSVGAAPSQGDETGAPQRPDTPRGGGAVEIPTVDDLGADLEAEIQAAMGSPSPVVPAGSPEGEAKVAQEASTEKTAAAETGEVAPGTKVEGTVLQLHGDDVFLDAGLRHNVVVSLRQFPDDKPPAVGDKVGVVVEEIDNDGLIRGRLPRGRHRAGGNWDALAEGQIVDCMVSATNKGGLQVLVSNLRAFLPASQIEIGYAGDLEKYVGQKITVQITEVNKKKRNLVVSRRVLLEAERAEGEAEFWSSVEVGQTFTGTVKTIKDYGAFINIGPVDGFLHIGEISWSRINHPSDVLQDGQNVEVKVLKLDQEKKRISLGMKQLEANPWTHAADKYSSGRTVTGKVTRIADFGAFVELEPGLEGLVHISQLAWRRVGSVSEILSVGESREFQVQEIDLKRKRVSLSLKALEKRPEAERPPEDQREQEQRTPRKPNPNLRGGRDGTEGGGGLFGNPRDFS